MIVPSGFSAISSAPAVVTTAPTAGTMNAAQTRRGWLLDWKALRPTRASRSRTVPATNIQIPMPTSSESSALEMATPAAQASPPKTAASPAIRKVMTNPFA